MTNTIQQEREISCYGMTCEHLDEIHSEACSGGMLIMGMMSDAQEEISRGLDERARQTLNAAKYLMSTKGVQLDDRGRML